ncbi:TIR domain-containing protein [Pedobacter aquatilis]|uniref:TIR domain-containing protein n=1 Tax=Pedobacter aquatilis TaxID=351343 RepID=UPI00292D7A8D|nr:TIR domain-containing protein [Pedobacter aquatilis]
MNRRCFISCKTEDFDFKKFILEDLNINMIDRSLNEPIDSTNEEYIMRVIRNQYLSDSTVTIHLIGAKSAENLGWEEQKYIKRELQASLYHGPGNTQNGLLGIVLPSMYHQIYAGDITCNGCQAVHNVIRLNDTTTIREFWRNYYLPNNKCSHADHERYCILVKWDDFIVNPEHYIEQAFLKRSQPIANYTIVRP